MPRSLVVLVLLTGWTSVTLITALSTGGRNSREAVVSTCDPGIRTEPLSEPAPCHEPAGPRFQVAATPPAAAAEVAPVDTGAMRSLMAVTAGDVTIEVVDAMTRMPVTDYRFRYARGDAIQPRLLTPPVDADGVTRLGWQWARCGDGFMVFPAAPDLVASEEFTLSRAGSWITAEGRLVNHILVEVQRAAALPVRVVDARGHPVAGAVVELLSPRPFQKSVEDTTVCVGRDGPGTEFGEAWRLDSASTDDDGRCCLRCSPVASSLFLRASAPGHRPEVLGDVCRGPGSGGYRLVLNPGGRLSGHARNLEALNGKSLAGLALEGLGNRSRNWPANALPLQVFDRDGSFEWTGLPRGRWQLVLYVADPVIDVPENPFISALKPIQVPHRVPLAIVELEEGTSQYLGIDLRDLPSLRRD